MKKINNNKITKLLQDEYSKMVGVNLVDQYLKFFKNNMNKILILGSNGYFGTVLFDYLKKEDDVKVLILIILRIVIYLKKKLVKTLTSCSSLLDQDYLKILIQ